MSGQITLGGHTYNNVSGEKFEEIKAILTRKDEPKKREIRHLDFGYYTSTDGGVWPCIYMQTDITNKPRRITAIGENDSCYMSGQDVNEHPDEYVVLGNLPDLVAETQKVEGLETEAFANLSGSDLKAFIYSDSMTKRVLIQELGQRHITLSCKDAFRFATQLLALCGEEKL